MEQWIKSLGTEWCAIPAVTAYLMTAYAIGRIFLNPNPFRQHPPCARQSEVLACGARLWRSLARRKISPFRAENGTGNTWRHKTAAQIITLTLGFDILIILGLLSGFCHLIGATFLLCLFLFGFLAGLIFFIKDFPSPFSLKQLAYFTPLISLAFFILGAALCHPTRWDELTYHIALPYRWLKDGYPAFYADNPYSGFPSAAGFSFRTIIALGGILSPRLLVWIIWLITLVSLYLLLRPGFSRWASIVLTFSFGSAQAVLMTASGAYTELFTLLQFAAMLLTFREAKHNENKVSVSAVIIGIFAGMAAAVKLTGIIIGIIAPLYFIWNRGPARLQRSLAQERRRTPFRWLASSVVSPKSGKEILKYSVFFIFTAMLFYLRPWILTGNPFYPYFAQIFTQNADAIEMSIYHHAIGSVKYGINSVSGFFVSPIILALPLSIKTFDGTFGWQFLLNLTFCIIGVIYTIRNKSYGTSLSYAGFALILYIFWFLTSQQARFLLPAVFLLTLCAKSGLQKLPSSLRKISVTLILTAAIIGITPKLLTHYALSWQAATGRIPVLNYLYSATGSGYFKAVYVISDKTPENAKIMLLFEHRGLYIPREYVIGTPFFQERFFTPPENIKNSSEILKALKENGITHVLAGLSTKDPDRIPEYLERCEYFSQLLGKLIDDKSLKSIWEDEGFALYKVYY